MMRKLKDLLRKNREPYSFYACIANNRRCGEESLPDDMVCAKDAREEQWDVEAPKQIIIHFRFAPKAKYKLILLPALIDEGVCEAHRSTARQDTLRTLYLERASRGIQLFGDKGVGPNVSIERALPEMEAYGYRLLQPPHILDCDKIYAIEDPDRVGERVVTLVYEYAPQKISVAMPEFMQPLIVRPWMNAWVWVNLTTSEGTQIHCVELSGLQFENPVPFCYLPFCDSLWLPELFEPTAA